MTERMPTRLLLLFAIIALAGCEEAIDPDNPYVERLVIDGIVTTGDSTIWVAFSKTLPLDRPARSDDGTLPDVSAVVIAGEGASAVRMPLVHVGGGYYRTAGTIVVPPGHYRLEAEWHGLHVSAETTAPLPVPIDSIRIIRRANPYSPGDSSETFEAIFTPHDDAVYHLSYRVKEFVGGSVTVLGRSALARRQDTLPSGEIHLLLDAYMDLPSNQIEAVLHTFDAPYYDFYQTYRTNNQGDGPFSTGNDPTRWNIEGDGIGIFIGHAIATREIE